MSGSERRSLAYLRFTDQILGKLLPRAQTNEPNRDVVSPEPSISNRARPRQSAPVPQAPATESVPAHSAAPAARIAFTASMQRHEVPARIRMRDGNRTTPGDLLQKDGHHAAGRSDRHCPAGPRSSGTADR